MAVGTGSHGSAFQSTITIPASSAHSVLGTSSAARSVLLHDFATGSYSTQVRLQFSPNAIQKYVSATGSSNDFGGPLTQPFGPGGGDYTRWDLNGGKWFLNPSTFNTRELANLIGSGSAELLRKGTNPGGWSILLDLKGQGHVADYVVNLTDVHGNGSGFKFTRTACYEPSDTTDQFNNTVVGDYTLTYATPGLYDPNFVLYASDYYVFGTANYTRYNNIYESYGYNTSDMNGTNGTYNNYYDAKKFYINLRQLNVPVVKKDSPTGAAIVDGQIITGMNPITNATIVLDKSLSRFPTGGGYSEWVIYKQLGTGGYAPASPGVDYNLGGGEALTSDLIHLTWLVGGTTYKVNCQVWDPIGGGPAQYQPTGLLRIEFPITTQTINNVNFPTVEAVVTPTSLFTNVVTDTTPLSGLRPFEISVSSVLNLTNASWTQQIDANPIQTFTLTDAEWRDEMAHKTNIVCRVKKTGTNIIVQQRNGLGPHTFTLLEGDYQVGYTVSPKSPLISELSALVTPDLN